MLPLGLYYDSNTIDCYNQLVSLSCIAPIPNRPAGIGSSLESSRLAESFFAGSKLANLERMFLGLNTANVSCGPPIFSAINIES